MAVPDAVLLFAVRRADARIHIEHDASWRTAAMNFVDPLAGQIGERRKVPFCREPARLEATHLACRRRASRSRFAADNPSNRRIMAKTFCVVDILVSGKPPKHGLPKHSDKRMPAVLAGACIREHLAGHRRKAERVVEFAMHE